MSRSRGPSTVNDSIKCPKCEKKIPKRLIVDECCPKCGFNILEHEAYTMGGGDINNAALYAKKLHTSISLNQRYF